MDLRFHLAGIFTLQSCETQKKITNVHPTFEQKAKHKEIKRRTMLWQN